jgi:hypothetical protein
MIRETKRIRLHIETKNNNHKPVSAVIVAEKFQKIQNIICYIVDDLEGNAPRRRGDFPNSVKERCELVLTGMSMGSLDAELSISDSQIVLPGEETHGEKAIAIGNEIVQAISEEGDIFTVVSRYIKNEERSYRIIREFESIWPDGESRYNINLNFGKNPVIFLDPARKNALRAILSRPPENTEKSVMGRLMEVRVDQKRSFQIDTMEGLVTCLYAPALEEKIVENIGRLVLVRGIMALERGKYTLSLKDEKSLEGIDWLPLSDVKIGGKSIKLKEPIYLEVSYEDDNYIISNDRFHLRAEDPSLKAAIAEINEEIEILSEDYVEAGLDELSQDALDLRRELISALGGESADAQA